MSARQDDRDEHFGREHSGLSLNPDDFGEDWHDADGELLLLLHYTKTSHGRPSRICMYEHAERGIWHGAIQLCILRPL